MSFGGEGVLDFVYFSFFNFRLGTYNFPSGSSAPSLKRPKACASAQREFCIRKCLEDFQFTGGNSPKKIPENVLFDGMGRTDGLTVIKSVLQISS